MTDEEERAWWLKMVSELRDVMKISDIAEEIGVSDRTVCNWQNGERPMGLKAIRVYLLHVKRCNPIHRSAVPSAEEQKG